MTGKNFDDDHLGFEALGETFTKLVQSMEGPRVISIEAGFGRSKTFFRERWAVQLRAAKEVVVEIDARQSDHSGDPVVTFIGALVGALGKDEETRMARAKKAGLKYSSLLGRTVVKAAVGKAADELFDVVDGRLAEQEDVSDYLKAAVEGFGDGMSKFASEAIAAQLVAEKARQELPAQLKSLLKALTFRKPNKRVVILIDELDRCHPDYAIQLLESMKLVFDRPGYVFVLMVNAEHLERIAAHRFVGWHKDEKAEAREPYLDKFVDMRLKLEAGKGKIGDAARALALELPEPEVPFGEGPEFTIERAAQVAADLAPISGLSMRQIKRVLLRVELAVRCYREVPVDVALLVWLAYRQQSRDVPGFNVVASKSLARSSLTPDMSASWEAGDQNPIQSDRDFHNSKKKFVFENCQELEGLSESIYRLPKLVDGSTYYPHYQVTKALAAYYIPEHQKMLDQIHSLAAD